MIYQNKLLRVKKVRPKPPYFHKAKLLDKEGLYSYILPSAGNALSTASYQLERAYSTKIPSSFKVPSAGHPVYMGLPKRASKGKVYRKMAADTVEKGVNAAEKQLEKARQIVESDISKRNLPRTELGGGQWFRDRFK